MRADLKRQVEAALREVEAHRLDAAPDACWAAVASGRGTPWQVRKACQGCAGLLRAVVLAEAWKATHLPSDEVKLNFDPKQLELLPLLSLVFATTFPPDEELPEDLEWHMSATWYDPAEWREWSVLSAGLRARDLYQSIYRGWAEGAIAVNVCPDDDATDLRQELHNPAFAPIVTGDLGLVGSGTRVDSWPDGMVSYVVKALHRRPVTAVKAKREKRPGLWQLLVQGPEGDASEGTAAKPGSTDEVPVTRD